MGARYEVLEFIGSGGCAHVVRARLHDAGPDGRDLALKVIRSELARDSPVVRRFRDEAVMLQQLDHPNIVRLHHLLSYEGRLVMELEFVAGATLERTLGIRGPIPVDVALAVVRQAADALIYAWDAPGGDGRPMRIVHRDLKPANLALSCDEGRLRLLDFGYAKADFEGRAAQSLHDVWGTVGFDAPESKKGHTTPAADVYALGVTLFVALTTRAVLLSMKPEHHDNDLAQILDSVSDEDARELVRRCVRHDASERPTLARLREEIDELLPQAEADEALRGFCDTHVRAIWDQRLVVEPKHERGWKEVSFLERDTPAPERAPLTPEQARQRVEAILARDDWADQAHQLDEILEAALSVPAEPFTAVLDRATVPVWKVWTRPATPAEVETALLILLRLDPAQARARAAALLQHGSERVRAVARFALGR